LSRSILLLIGAVIVIGLALFLMYVNPSSEQAKKTNNASELPKLPQPETSKETKNPNKDNKTSETPKPTLNPQPNTTKDANPSKEYSQQIEIGKTEIFPASKLIAAGGRVAFVVYVKNPTNAELIGQNVALLLDGEPYQRRSVDIPAGETRTVSFAIEGIAKGNHEIQINQEKLILSVLDISNAPKREKANIPADPKLVSAAQGITSIGLPGGNLVLSISNGFGTLNPVVASDNDTIEITRQINGFLIELNPLNGKPEPGLASSWEYSSDARELKLYLRQGVKFSDGKEFTADDVVFTFSDLLFNSDINARESEGFRVGGSYVAVEKLDTYVVRFLLAKPFRPLLYALAAVAILPKHKLAEKIAKLQPGARGYWNGAKGLFDQHRDALSKASTEDINSVSEKLNAFASTIEKKDVPAIEKQVRDVFQRIEAIQSAVTDAFLKSTLDRVKAYLTRMIDTAQRGQFEGVSPLLFSQVWSVTEAREHPENIVGLGPFVFKSYDPQRRVVLERNLSYWKLDEKGLQLPYMNRLVFDVLPSADAALKRFQDGQLDMMEPQASDWAKVKAEAEAKKWKLVGDSFSEDIPEEFNMWPGEPVEFLALNFDSSNAELQKLFRDVRFRKALFNAIDRSKIAENAYSKLAFEYGFVTRISSNFLNFSTLAMDLNKAKALLDEIGLIDTNNDGLRENSQRKSLVFSILVNQENQSRLKSAQLILEQLKQVGIKVDIEQTDFQTYTSRLLGGQFETALAGFGNVPEFYFTSGYRKSNGPLHFWHRTELFDWEKQIDLLIEKYGQTYTAEKVLDYQEIRIIESENVPVIYTVRPYYLIAFNQSIANAESMTQLSAINMMTDVLWWRDDNRRFQP